MTLLMFKIGEYCIPKIYLETIDTQCWFRDSPQKLGLFDEDHKY